MPAYTGTYHMARWRVSHFDISSDVQRHNGWPGRSVELPPLPASGSLLEFSSPFRFLASYNNPHMVFQILHNLFLWIYIPIVFTIWAPIGVILGLLSPPFRHQMHKISQRWGKFVALPALGVKVDVRQDAPLPHSACIFMSNHQSYLDILLLLGYLPGFFSFIAKKELFSIPFLGWYIRGAGHIFIEREDSVKSLDALKKSLQRLKAGIPIIVFPEGTRGNEGEMLPFKRGGFLIAAQAGVPIVPIRIRGTSKILPRGSVWVRSGPVSIHIGKQIDVQNMSGNKKEREKQLMESVRNAIGAL